MTDFSGIVHTTFSGISVVFKFEDIAAGAIYFFSASGERFTFNQPSRIYSISEDVTNIVLIGEPNVVCFFFSSYQMSVLPEHFLDHQDVERLQAQTIFD